MTRSIKTPIVRLSILLAAGCTGEVHEPQTWKKFSESTFEDPNAPGVLIVGGDIGISRERLAFFQETNDGDATRQGWGVQRQPLIINTENGSDTRWSDADGFSLNYCVSDQFGKNKPAVIEAMDAATRSWDDFIGARFVYVQGQDTNCDATNTNVKFDVRPVTSGRFLARAFFPNDKRSARSILVDESTWTSIGGKDGLTVTNLLAHELGHSLGFRHEHVRPEAGPCRTEDSNWRELTPYDQGSVMHYAWCNGDGTWSMQTPRDYQGAISVYGLSPALSMVVQARI